MNTKEHRQVLNEAFLVNRKLKLEGLIEQNKSSILAEIAQLHGIVSTSIVDEIMLLKVSYDGSKLGMNDFEHILNTFNCQFATDWWSRCKLNWYRSIDNNIRDNAAHVPHCCNKPPAQ
ncbi:MAG: cation transporter [SAR324 cluster bacterium]|nr:cation transporter [SAR324 cluster bacterium]MBL7034747.1 cation transporter [SAR324 cluster bacterium]